MQNSYATALWKTIQSGTDVKRAAQLLREALVRRGRVSLLPQIARSLARLAAREAQKNRSVLIIARKSDEKVARKESGAHEAELALDESLIGGWRLESGELVRDTSWKSSLLSIYNLSTK